MRIQLIFILTAVCLVISRPTYSITVPEPPRLTAKGYILMDYQSGKILASSRESSPLPPASLTKIMTAYLVGLEINAERLNWDDLSTISVNAWSMKFPNSSKMFIQPKDKVSILDLMKGVIVQSGNDASVALAEHVAGNEQAFVEMMNKKANAIGMKNTRFINAHGLDGESIQTSPQDIAILMQQVIKDTPDVYQLYKIRDFTWNRITQYNQNKLLWDNSLNVDGGKTGYTRKAGYSLAASAKQGRLRLISVVMGSESKQLRIEESRQLLSYGMRYFDTKKFAKKSNILTYGSVWKGNKDKVAIGVNNDVYLTLPQNQIDQIKRTIELKKTLQAPLAKGQAIGYVKWLVNGELIHREPLVTKEAIYPASWIGRTTDGVHLFFDSVVDKFSD